jgi:hypothetical protein
VTSSPIALRRAIDAYRARPYVPNLGHCGLAPNDEHMLDRLQASNLAQKAFAYLELDDNKGVKFVADCVWAGRLFKGLHTQDVEAFRSAPDPEKARAALAELECFFRGSTFLTIPNSQDRPTAPSWEELQRCPRPYIKGPDRGPQGDAIDLLARAIDDEERLRKEYRPSQKSGAEAARRRALSYVRQSVRYLAGEAKLKSVATIADVVFGLKDGTITVDDVKNAKATAEGRRKRVV